MRIHFGKCDTCAAMRSEVSWLRKQLEQANELIDRLKTAGTPADRRYFEEEEEPGVDEVLMGQ